MGKQNNQKTKIAKIIVDAGLCIGCGSCAAVASKTFELNAENKSIVKNSENDDNETILMAAKVCPVKAIILYDKNGKQICP